MNGRMANRGGAAAEWLVAAAALLTVYAVVVAWTGGFNVRVAGVRLRSHDWARPLIAAAATTAAALWLDRRRVAAVLARAWSMLERSSGAMAVACVALAWTAFAGPAFATFSNGGADSYGYVGQARLLAHGNLTDTVALSPAFTWPDAELTLRPLAFTQGRGRGEIAPIYPPGLSLLMAPLTYVDERALYLIVPVFGMLAVWLTYRLGVRLGEPLAGACGALLLSASPTFLFQLVQPMSDVPAAACWLWALLLAFRRSAASAAGAGAVASMAILIRPNLAPLAGVIVLATAWPADRAALTRIAISALAMVPGLSLLAWIQLVRYGSALASGYGGLQDAFALSNVGPNLARYPRWLTETHTPFVWLSLAAPVWLWRRREVAARGWLALALVVGTWIAYLPYIYFQPDEWFYTRFLLPAIPIMLVFAWIVLLRGIAWLAAPLRGVAVAAALGALVFTTAASAARHGVFEIRAQEQKYPRAGLFVRDTLPRNSFVLALQHSGSIRYYADRPTLRWDLLAPTALDNALATLRASGFEPFLVVDAGEDPVFRRKFEEARQRAAMRMTPIAVLGDVRVYQFDR